MQAVTLVVPCYNEGKRLDDEAFLSLVDADGALRLLFVDDGSKDDTAARLQALAARAPGRIAVLGLDRNRGKAEAVRRGLAQALDEGPAFVGYLDADLATPVAEVRRLLGLLRGGKAAVLLASRVSLLGRDIQRRPARHYLGRIFASAASVVLRLSVYDTQCGAKLFRATPALRAALAEPFLSRWIFDVELLGRLLTGTAEARPLDAGEVVEEPLLSWRDVPGSKLRPGHAAIAARDMARIALDLARRRRAVRGPQSLP
jgi:glycosyltransferase involved in cell wall biosynthesis